MGTKGLSFVLGIVFSLTYFPVYAHSIKFPEKPAHTCSAKATEGTVALTFDDGPSPIFTRQVLEILKKYHVNATFFVLGQNAKAHPQFLREMIAAGHVVGDHSMTHPVFTRLAAKRLYREVVGSEKIIYKITGIKPGLFRFPYGSANKKVRNYVMSKGMKPIFWGYTPDDYRRPGADIIADRVIEHAASGQIILLHDGPSRRQQTIDALPKIIEGVKKKGLGFSVLCH